MSGNTQNTQISQNAQNEVKKVKYSAFKSIFQGKNVINLCSLTVCYSVVSFNYFMVAVYLKYVGGNIFINSTSNIVAETVGNFVGGFAWKLLGTKKGLLLSFSGSLV